MKKIKKIEKIQEEAQFIKEKKMDYVLAKVLSGDWKGTKKEREELGRLKDKLKDDIYIEAIYVLTHKIIRDVKEARHLYLSIIKHKDRLIKELKRDIGIEVAALDYFKNVIPKLDQPEIIEKAKLAKLATKAITDEATGIYERDTLFVNLDSEIERARRYRRPLSLLFCDLDDFKKVNDSYGHKSGDIVLKKASERIRSVLRATDTIYRYGGEEFICVLPETDAKSAHIAARRIRKKVSSSPIALKKDDTKLTITLSIGVAQYGVSGVSDMESFINAADTMMYKAKEDGKNCVRVHGEEYAKKAIEKRGKAQGRKKKRVIIKGRAMSPGISMGNAFIYKDILTRDMMAYSITEHQIKDELKRIENAIKNASKDLQKMKDVVKTNIDKQHADIFETHKELLKDEQLIRDLETELERELINASQCIF